MHVILKCNTSCAIISSLADISSSALFTVTSIQVKYMSQMSMVWPFIWGYLYLQVQQVIKTDVSEASDLTDACRAVDKKLQKLARGVVEQQREIEACKVLLQSLTIPCKICTVLPCLSGTLNNEQRSHCKHFQPQQFLVIRVISHYQSNV